MIELHPDNCHSANTIRYSNPSVVQSPRRAQYDPLTPRVRFFRGVFVPNKELLKLDPPELQELLIALMGLGTTHSVRVFRKDPAVAMASQATVLELLGIKNWNEAPPLLFDSGQMRIIKQRNRFPISDELTQDERKIVTFLSTGITGNEISALMNMDKEILKKTVDHIGERAGVHNVTGLKTLGWLSGMAIGSMQHRFAAPAEASVPSELPQPQLSPPHLLA